MDEEEVAREAVASILSTVLSRTYTITPRKLWRFARAQLRRGDAARALRSVCEREWVIDHRGRVWKLKLKRSGKELRAQALCVGEVERVARQRAEA